MVVPVLIFPKRAFSLAASKGAASEKEGGTHEVAEGFDYSSLVVTSTTVLAMSPNTA